MALTIEEAQDAVAELARIDKALQLAMLQAYHAPDKVIEAWKQEEKPSGLADLAARLDPAAAEAVAIREAALKFVEKSNAGQ